MQIISDIPIFVVIQQCSIFDFDKVEQYTVRSLQAAADKVFELINDDDDCKCQVIEFNHVEGYSKDVSQEVSKYHANLEFDGYVIIFEPGEYLPHYEYGTERLTGSELGVGRWRS